MQVDLKGHATLTRPWVIRAFAELYVAAMPVHQAVDASVKKQSADIGLERPQAEENCDASSSMLLCRKMGGTKPYQAI